MALDYIRVRDFLVEGYRRTGRPPGWLIDRRNFVRHFSQVVHETFTVWPDTVGLWQDEQGEIVAMVCSEGEEKGEEMAIQRGYERSGTKP